MLYELKEKAIYAIYFTETNYSYLGNLWLIAVFSLITLFPT